MNVSIIIPNYNGEELLKKNLPKVIEAADYYAQKTNQNIEIIFVDDGSTDDSIKIIQNSKFKVQNYNLKFKIIENEKNLGFSSTINIGVKEATGDVVVLLNTDVSPQIEFLLPLVVHFSDDKIFAVGCMDKSIENGKTILRGRGVGKWEKGFLIHSRGEVDKASTLWVGGGSGAFRRFIWEKLGGFCPLYNPFYWEDIDLSYRAQKCGYKVLFEPKSVVIHEHEKGAIKNIYSENQIKTIAYRNQFIFVWVNLTDLSLQIMHFFWLPIHIIKAVFRGDFAFIIGFLKAFILLPKIIQFSFKIQKYFKIKDRFITKRFNQ